MKLDIQDGKINGDNVSFSITGKMGVIQFLGTIVSNTEINFVERVPIKTGAGLSERKVDFTARRGGIPSSRQRARFQTFHKAPGIEAVRTLTAGGTLKNTRVSAWTFRSVDLN